MPLTVTVIAASVLIHESDAIRLRAVRLDSERPRVVAWSSNVSLYSSDREVLALPHGNGGNAWHATAGSDVSLEVEKWNGCGEVRVIVFGNLAGGSGNVEQIVYLGSRRMDRNRDNRLDSGDFFDFLAAFFAGDESADHDRDGTVNSADVLRWLECFL